MPALLHNWELQSPMCTDPGRFAFLEQLYLIQWCLFTDNSWKLVEIRPILKACFSTCSPYVLLHFCLCPSLLHLLPLPSFHGTCFMHLYTDLWQNTLSRWFGAISSFSKWNKLFGSNDWVLPMLIFTWLKVNTKCGWIQYFLMPMIMPGTLSYSFYHGENIWGHLRVKWRPYDSSGPTLRSFFQFLLTVPITRHKTNTIFPLIPTFLVPWVAFLCQSSFLFDPPSFECIYLHFHLNMSQNGIVGLILVLLEAQVQDLFCLLSQQVLIYLCFY